MRVRRTVGCALPLPGGGTARSGMREYMIVQGPVIASEVCHTT